MIDLIQAATLNNNNQETQKQAEIAILKQRQEQPELFFMENSEILRANMVDPMIRQSAGALLIGALKLKVNNTYLWYAVTPPNRSSLKELLLGTLLDAEKSVRRASANIVAAICCIQIPRNQWEGIAQRITSNIQSQDLVLKQASIMTIGFICESLKEFDFYFQDSLQDPILAAILLGAKDAEKQIAETALKALRDGMSAFGSILQNTQCCDYLMTQMVHFLKTKTFVQLTLQALIQFVKCYYVLMQSSYVQALTGCIDPIMRNTTEYNLCVLAMEFWTSFVQQQKNVHSNPDSMKYVTGPLAFHLLQVLLSNLCALNADDEEGNGVSEAAASTLQAIFSEDSSEFEQKILYFTQQTIHHQNWRLRQASIRAFALLLLGLKPQRCQVLVNISLLQLVSLVNDGKKIVKLSAVKALALISEEVPQVILKHQKFLPILQLITQVSTLGEKFLANVCVIIDHLCQAKQSTSYIGVYARDLLKFLLQICVAATTPIPSVICCFTTIMHLIKCSKNSIICNEYLSFVIANFPRLQGLVQEKRDLFYSGFFNIIKMCLMTLIQIKSSITNEQLTTLYNLVLQYYNKATNVEGDGFSVVGSLVAFTPNDRKIVDDFWKYIKQGFKKVNQLVIFKGVISCVCDFALTHGELIPDKMEEALIYLIIIYEKNPTHVQLRSEILMCIGEMYLHCGKVCQKHLGKLMSVLDTSCQAILAAAPWESNFVETMQQSIIETIACVLHGLKSKEGKKLFGQSLSFVIEFIKTTTEASRYPKPGYLKDCLLLLADGVNLLPNEIAKLSQCTFVKDRLLTLVKFNRDGKLNSCIRFVSSQFRITL